MPILIEGFTYTVKFLVEHFLFDYEHDIPSCEVQL